MAAVEHPAGLLAARDREPLYYREYVLCIALLLDDVRVACCACGLSSCLALAARSDLHRLAFLVLRSRVIYHIARPSLVRSMADRLVTPRPNQTMQRTAGRSAFPLSMTSTFNLPPHKPSPA